MFRSSRRRAVSAVAAAGLSLTALVLGASPGSAGAASQSAAQPKVVTVPVSFTVRNVNRSKVPCASDGKTYTVRGDLVAPASALTAPSAVTLYLHGLSFGEFFWDFNAPGGYNYARKMAHRGQASVIVDRLGYGRSDKPVGTDICVGARADIAHQMALDLRAGTYSVAGATAPAFGKVFLAGHSYGGQIAEVEAYSFGDIDGLVVISYSDVGQTAQLKKNAAYTAKVCAAGGMPVTPGGPGHYAPFGPPSGATASLFNDVAPAVLARALPKLTLDPCGDTASFPKATRVDLRLVHTISVPVLIIQGGADALFAASAVGAQAGLFTGSPAVSTVVIPGTAHAITLERTRNHFVRAMAKRLAAFEHRSAS